MVTRATQQTLADISARELLNETVDQLLDRLIHAARAEHAWNLRMIRGELLWRDLFAKLLSRK